MAILRLTENQWFRIGILAGWVREAKKFRVVYAPEGQSSTSKKREDVEADDEASAQQQIVQKNPRAEIASVVDYDSLSDWEKGLPFVDREGSYRDRIQQKEQQESFLWDRINSATPWIIERSTTREDMSGIDARIKGLKGGKQVAPQAIALKTRDVFGEGVGDDILIEVIKPWPITSPNNVWSGRDMKADVDKFFCVNKNGLLRVYNASDIRNLAMEMTKKFVQRYRSNPRIRSDRTPMGEVKVVRDHSQQSNFRLGNVEKLVAFVNPSYLKPTYEMQLPYSDSGIPS